MARMSHRRQRRLHKMAAKPFPPEEEGKDIKPCARCSLLEDIILTYEDELDSIFCTTGDEACSDCGYDNCKCRSDLDTDVDEPKAKTARTEEEVSAPEAAADS